jgi:hypothetical protein
VKRPNTVNDGRRGNAAVGLSRGICCPPHPALPALDAAPKRYTYRQLCLRLANWEAAF